MARRCDLCGKAPSTGHCVSHANNKTKRRFAPNLQRVRAEVHGRVLRLRVCARCIKSGRLTKAPPSRSPAQDSASSRP